MRSQHETEIGLGQAMFGHAELGDRRRTARLVHTFDQMCRHPGGSLPDKLSSPADLKALYRLCECEKVSHAALIGSMRQHTLRQISEHEGSVLVVHDATELDYTSMKSLAEELGQIGTGGGRGYICQNVLAISAETGHVLGLLDQILHCRDEAPEKETLAEHRERETRESLLWVKGTAHLPADPRLIDVADQGSDTFEFLEHEYKSGRRFVVRAHKKRKLSAGHEPTATTCSMQACAANLPELGRFTMDVQAQRGRVARKDAEFILRGGPVLVHPPHARYGNHGRDPLPLYLVRVSEVQPPGGEEAIEWNLFTNEPVKSLNDGWRVTGWYEQRWKVEEFHKAKKTGCQIEDMQFTSVARLEPAIALVSAVALTLLNLRDLSRREDAQTRLATEVISREYVEVLSIWRHQKVLPNWTIHEFFMALARLGGHQNRKCDHPPGWLVLWRGWMKLQSMLDGYQAARRRKKCG